MLKDLDFSHLEFISATKNISTCDNMKIVLCTITFLDKKDSISHLTGVEEAFAKLQLEEDGKYIKLAASYYTEDGDVCTDRTIKVIFNEVNNQYRNVTRSERDDITTILEDLLFVDMVFDRSDEKFVYM